MISISSVLTLMLFSGLSSHLVSVALPASKTDDGLMDQDALSPLLVDGPEAGVLPPLQRRSFLLEHIRDEDGNPKIILSDERLDGVRGLSFARAAPLPAGRSLSHSPAESSLKANRRDVDLDMLRCMIGRVYRPCWEV